MSQVAKEERDPRDTILLTITMAARDIQLPTTMVAKDTIPTHLRVTKAREARPFMLLHRRQSVVMVILTPVKNATLTTWMEKAMLFLVADVIVLKTIRGRLKASCGVTSTANVLVAAMESWKAMKSASLERIIVRMDTSAMIGAR